MYTGGVLMPVASLPNRFGSGDFGQESYRFVDDLAEAGFGLWQILPLNPLGYGNSPYQPFSSFAMDEIYISLDLLEKKGLLEHVPSYLKDADAVRYEECRKFRTKYLRKAYAAFKGDSRFDEFSRQEWVRNYTVFKTFKELNEGRCWLEWEDPLMKDFFKQKNPDLSPYEDEIRYQAFLQYMLFEQWNDLKDYANSRHILIVGDVPFYVGLDSADVWADRSSFLLDRDGHPTFIAGVPPDYFSADGQRWGNPIYDWKRIEKNDFDFWVKRLGFTKNMFDMTRVDHFRAFDTYWKISAECPTAIEGKWIEAPGYKLFDRLFKEMPDLQIIAEDLGDLRPEVYTLRDHYHFPGMNVIQFTFRTDSENRTAENCLCYTGTHDNDTLYHWYRSMSLKQKRAVRKWMNSHKYKDKDICMDFFRYALDSKAKMVVIPAMDILKLDERGRLNTPSTVGAPNWMWRMPSYTAFEKKMPVWKDLLKQYKRTAG